MGQETSKILVVDDDMRLRSLLERYLLEQGYQVRSAANAEQMDRLLERENFHLMVLILWLLEYLNAWFPVINTRIYGFMW